MINMVVAYERNRGIGRGGALPWGHALKRDLKMYKELTRGGSVIMGRTTFESLGKPFTERENIVISRTHFVHDGVISVDSIAQALEVASKQPFIIGGGTIYELGLPYADRVYATEIDAQLEADTFFPELDERSWHEVSRVRNDTRQTGEPYTYDFVVYERNRA